MNCVFISVLFLSAFYEAKCEVTKGSVVLADGKFLFKEGILEGAIAFGVYNDSIESVGWGILDIKAETYGMKYTGDQVMYAAGMLEGALTAVRIRQHYSNLQVFLFDNRQSNVKNKSCNFFTEQQRWMKNKIKVKNESKFWIHASFIQSQFEGLLYGFNMVSKNSMSLCDMMVINSVGDLIDLFNVFNRKEELYYLRMSKKRQRQYAQEHGHCSALIKVTPGYENLYMGHDSWFIYSAMLRIYKHYDLQVYEKEMSNCKSSFSSYPGFLSSLDDFYLLGSGMVMLQTSNNIYNTTLYDLVVPQSLLAWHRVRTANLLATSPRMWGQMLKQYNSGTYTNQYMVLDLKRFTPNVGFKEGALYVVEQIPGYVESRDQTSILREGYWASYNVPFYEYIYNVSGYAAVAQNDTDSSHDLAPRAKIFRRDQGTVDSMENMKKMLRYNNFKHDSYSEKDACDSICCRGDLKHSSRLDGCYDTKVTDYFLAKNLTSFAISGPTTGGDSKLPPFSWKGQTRYHEGMPETYNFPFVKMRPRNFDRKQN